MKTISVMASSSYSVLVGQGLLSRVGQEIRCVTKAQKAVVVSDSNVAVLYGQTVREQLMQAGLSVCEFTFPAGEANKNANTYLNLLNFMAGEQISRNDCLIALGGGVVGDLTGFAAATYLRGVDYIQIPTTLLAAVDSSVGGKTAIDLTIGKNLVGAFWQPRLVVCDTDTLDTLSADIFRDGCAEVIKYAILYDADLFAHLMQAGLSFHREMVIARCIELKRDVVAVDEFDKGLRQKLNLGHTFGHGIEAASNFTLSHGKAVAIGMAMAARCGTKAGITEPGVLDEVLRVLNRFALPVHTEYAPEDILNSALSDKKRFGGTVNLIIPKTIGSCIISPTAVESLSAMIEAGM